MSEERGVFLLAMGVLREWGWGVYGGGWETHLGVSGELEELSESSLLWRVLPEGRNPGRTQLVQGGRN